jgi:hypothetical protein
MLFIILNGIAKEKNMADISVVWRDGKQYVKVIREGEKTLLIELAKKRLTCEELSEVLWELGIRIEVDEYLRKRLKQGETINVPTEEEKKKQKTMIEKLFKKQPETA